MAKKKPTIKVEFMRNYAGPEGVYIKGNTDTFDKGVAENLIATQVAKVYVPPPICPSKLPKGKAIPNDKVITEG